MRHLVVSILIFHPFQHAPASVVVKVGINIGQRYTVGVKETFEKQVVLDGVNLRYAQTIGHNRACGRPTSGANHHVQFVLCRVDKVLHDEEVARKTHCLHNVQLKVHTLAHFLCKRFAIQFLCPIVCQLSQIVGLKLYSIQLFVSAQFLNLSLALFGWQLVLSVFVGCELVVQFFFRYTLSPLFLRSEVFGYGEERHNGRMVYRIDFHLI